MMTQRDIIQEKVAIVHKTIRLCRYYLFCPHAVRLYSAVGLPEVSPRSPRGIITIILFLSSTLLRPSQTLFGVSAVRACVTFPKKLEFAKKKNGNLPKKMELVLNFGFLAAEGPRPKAALSTNFERGSQ